MATIKDDVLEAVKLLGVATVAMIQELVPNAKETTIASACISMVKRGVLVRLPDKKRQGKTLVYQYAINPTPTASQPREAKAPTNAGLQARLESASAKIAELEAWKAAAIVRYPNLGVDPKVLEARQIVAKVFRDAHDANNAAAVESGSKDRSPIMLATLAALGG